MSKSAKVAILGLPNVGKSTLFNRLLDQKKSLVHSLPGMTRDGITAFCTLEKKHFILIDTGGLLDSKEELFSTQVSEKAWEAAGEADLILFVLDGKRGLMPIEKELYLSLKKLGKPLLIVINKTDSAVDEDRLGDFYNQFNEPDIIPVSAEHKRNLDVLSERIESLLPSSSLLVDEKDALKIALVGRINVGKSSIINRLCGKEKLIVSEIPGTTRDSTDTLVKREGRYFVLLDTAGIRKLSRTRDKREKAGIIRAKKDIKRADVICFIMDAQECPTRQDAAIAHLARESEKPLVLAVNKWDLVEKENQTVEDYKKRLFNKLDFVSYASVLFISALTGMRVIKILEAAERAYENASQWVPTSQLNSFLERLIQFHPPYGKGRTPMKIHYVTQKGVLPPTFILFTHSRYSLAPAYEIFLKKRLQQEFGFAGTPVRIVLRKN
ncbi:MAG: ribosome biogenesis GTPase Der [Candidatus Aminicenantes bacterium]|nr:ribosome biogenesis GTPase Der [Candidatus Aminicenantes bacterium]